MDTIVTPVTVITLDSTRIVHSIKADLVARYFPPVVRLVQYDQSLPVIAVSLMQNGQTYTLPSGAAANIRVHKPDATYVYNPALGCDSTRNIVYFEVTQAMAAATGDGLAIVEIVVDGDIAGTSLITLHFEENPVPEDAIESSDEWETIYELGERIIASTVTPVSTAAGMTDHNVVYLYTGTESGWNQGHMYYYNGTTWVDAGIAVTDTTLSVAGLAADAKATGDEIATVKDGFSKQFDLFKTVTLKNGFIDTDGSFHSNSSWYIIDKLPTYGSKTLILKGWYSKLTTGGLNNAWAYDKNGASLGGIYQQTASGNINAAITLPTGTAFISICNTVSAMTNHGYSAYLSSDLDRVDYLYNNIYDYLYENLSKKTLSEYVRTGIWNSVTHGKFATPIVGGSVITILPLSSSDDSATGLQVSGVYGEDQSGGWDTLNVTKFGSVGRIITNRDYHHLQVSSYPYNSGKTITFKLHIGTYQLSHNNFYNTVNKRVCSIFRKVVCCGDSFTSGDIFDSEGVQHPTNEDYAWCHHMSTITGGTYVNCGSAGANVLTWQTAERGLPKAVTSGRTQAYIVGLGINDGSTGTPRYVPVGTASDIGTDNETYYGGLSKIIVSLHNISPDAHIFVNTNPNIAYPNYDYTAYNTAVRDIVDYYQSTYKVHLIDLDVFKDMYHVDSIMDDIWHGHMTAIGYQQFAEIYVSVLSDYISNHISDFQDVAFIAYD